MINNLTLSRTLNGTAVTQEQMKAYVFRSVAFEKIIHSVNDRIKAGVSPDDKVKKTS